MRSLAKRLSVHQTVRTNPQEHLPSEPAALPADDQVLSFAMLTKHAHETATPLVFQQVNASPKPLSCNALSVVFQRHLAKTDPLSVVVLQPPRRDSCGFSLFKNPLDPTQQSTCSLTSPLICRSWRFNGACAEGRKNKALDKALDRPLKSRPQHLGFNPAQQTANLEGSKSPSSPFRDSSWTQEGFQR